MLFDRLYCNGSKNPLGIGLTAMLTWNFKANGDRNEVQTAYRVTVYGGNQRFDTGFRKSDSMRFCLSDEFNLQPGTRYTWQVSACTANGIIVSPEQNFETAINDFSDAAWLTCGEQDVSSPIFERTISLSHQIRSARAYVTGLGLLVCRCNDLLCSDHLLMPPNTIYDTMHYFETFDITALLHKGENRFEIQLGNGYNMDYSQYGFRYSQVKGCRAVLIITLENGETLRYVTDEGWTWRESEIVSNGLYAGETFDARRKDLPHYSVVICEEAAPKGASLPNEMPPIRIMTRRDPVAHWKTELGETYDFGSNVQGFTEITVCAPRGTQITLNHCEMLFPDGTPDPETNRRAKAEDIYICSGEGTEVYHPLFTYHGFRYVTVSGLENAESFSIQSLQISADVETVGNFLCSDASFNRIHELCAHSIRCNLVSIPTDCPVRDERTPCQMDSQMVEAACIHNFNMETYYRKWMRDITSSLPLSGEGNPDWHGDYIMLAYRMYRFYGDDRLITALYPRIMDDLAAWMTRSKEGILDSGFGDWCLPNNNTWESYHGCRIAVNTSLFYAYCCIGEEISDLLNNKTNRLQCAQWKEIIRSSFITYYVHEDGTAIDGKQTDMILPLYFGLLEGEIRTKVQEALCKKLAEDGHLDTGGFGTMALPAAAAYSGGIDLLPKIFGYGAYPGYGFWMATGATSLWEQWAVKGSMHSHSHAMHGGIDAAFYRVICGLTTIDPGYKRFRVAPCLPTEMQFCQCELQTPSGLISVKIDRLYDGLELRLRVPPNTQAELALPDCERYADCGLWDGERCLDKQKRLTLGSGVYQFRLVPERILQT